VKSRTIKYHEYNNTPPPGGGGREGAEQQGSFCLYLSYALIDKDQLRLGSFKIFLDIVDNISRLDRVYFVKNRINTKRFPTDFMFQLSREEFDNMIFQTGTSSWGGTR